MAEGTPRLHLVRDAVTDLAPVAGGYSLRTEGGASYLVVGAVLATGNLTGPGRATHDQRYDAAEDFMTAVYKLWEGS